MRKRNSRSACSGKEDKLALYLPSLRGGGAERVMVTLANSFAERGYEVDLVLASAEGPYLDEVEDGVRVVDLGCPRVRRSLPGLVRYLKRERPRAMLSAMGHANAIALVARMIARVPTRLIVSERTHFSVSLEQAGGFWARLTGHLGRRIYRRADGIIAVSEGVSDDLAVRAGLPRERIEVVFNPAVGRWLEALAAEPANEFWSSTNGGPLVVAMGRLTEAKDFTTLIRAFALLREQLSARLVILGEGPLRGELEKEAENLGVSSNVYLPGFVDNPFPVITRADLFVLSSAWEGLPNGLIQAMACGTPVVSTDCPSGPDEILEGGRWGHLVPVGDETALAEAMVATLDECTPPDVVARAAEFSVDRAADGYLAVMLSNKE
ncbi:glycosyltransferase [Thiohalospira halophila]|uniref:glycosyltransferase n=1 Tax=Thiohalospira halophila TaxID=381300 RepID=UPI0023DD4277|nr:glycosyltransferase [Thiohalospira halophila]